MLSKKQLAQTFDHTLLKPNATNKQIARLCQEANEYQFKAICIPPSYIEMAKKQLSQAVELCTVIGFPTGYQLNSTKFQECLDVLKLGATEVDTVINIGDLKGSRHDLIVSELSQLAQICHKHDAILKVILETSELTDEEKAIACQLATKSQVDFVKTSTGFSSSGAQIQDIQIMKSNISNSMRIKASGGIRNRQQALSFLEAGAHRLGLSSGISIMKEYDL